MEHHHSVFIVVQWIKGKLYKEAHTCMLCFQYVFVRKGFIVFELHLVYFLIFKKKATCFLVN